MKNQLKWVIPVIFFGVSAIIYFVILGGKDNALHIMNQKDTLETTQTDGGENEKDNEPGLNYSESDEPDNEEGDQTVSQDRTSDEAELRNLPNNERSVKSGTPRSGGQQSNLKIYAIYSRYNNDTKNFLRSKGVEEYRLITVSFIDPDKDGKVNVDRVESFLKSNYPQKNSEGTCVIDWETKPYQDLRDFDGNSKEFKTAEAEFLKVIQVIRSERPNVKIGIYGIPFRVTSPSMRKYNANQKFDNLLKKTDFIAIAPYIRFTDDEIGRDGNTAYLKENLQIALDHGARLGNMPVVPFVWYRVHPSNKKFGTQVLSKEKMDSYMNTLISYRNNGRGIDGILWWDPKEDLATTRATLSASSATVSEQGNRENLEIGRDRIIQSYTDILFNGGN